MVDVAITITIAVTEQQIENTLCSALEGGSNYWCEIRGYIHQEPTRQQPYAPSYLTTPLSPFGKLILFDKEEEKEMELTREKLIEGVRVMAQKYPKHFGDMMSEEGDSTTGDVFLQCALFGEVIYG